MKRFYVFLFLLWLTASVHASGPQAPKGWNGSHEPTLSNGEPCCMPADLNGTKLVGGAFVLISDNQKEFAIFALTYTPPLNERWHLLEKHPIAQLADYRISIEEAGRFKFRSVKVCRGESACVFYRLESANGSFKKTSHVAKAG